MLNNSNHSDSAMLSSFGTSAHETGISLPLSSFDSNSLRYYSPATGTRKRKPSTTSAMRQSLVKAILDAYPGIRRVKVKDCGQLFSARAWFYGGRVVHVKAYSLHNLRNLLCEQIWGILGEA